MTEMTPVDNQFAIAMSEMPDWIGLCGDAGAYPYAGAFWLLTIIRDAGYEVVKREA